MPLSNLCLNVRANTQCTLKSEVAMILLLGTQIDGGLFCKKCKYTFYHNNLMYTATTRFAKHKKFMHCPYCDW